MTVHHAAVRIAARIAGLSVAIALFAGLAAVFSSESVTRWIGLVGFAAVIVGSAVWASRDARAIDLN